MDGVYIKLWISPKLITRPVRFEEILNCLQNSNYSHKMKLILVVLMSLIGLISSEATPNLLDAPVAEAGKDVPSVLTGKPKPLLDEEVCQP